MPVGGPLMACLRWLLILCWSTSMSSLACPRRNISVGSDSFLAKGSDGVFFAIRFSDGNVGLVSRNELANRSTFDNELLPILRIGNLTLIYDSKSGKYTPLKINRPESIATSTEVLVPGFEQTEPAISQTEPAISQTEPAISQTEPMDYEDEDDAIFGDGIDEFGCDTFLRDKKEDECFEEFEDFVREAMYLEDERERQKSVCCAMERYERCCVVSFLSANCIEDRDSIKKNLKAARIFLATVSDTSCAIYRGKCNLSSSATLYLPSSLLVSLGTLLTGLLL